MRLKENGLSALQRLSKSICDSGQCVRYSGTLVSLASLVNLVKSISKNVKTYARINFTNKVQSKAFLQNQGRIQDLVKGGPHIFLANFC